MQELSSVWKGSEKSFQQIKEQIAERFGGKVAESYHPEKNAFTFAGWRQRGYIVKKGQKGLKMTTMIEKKGKDGSITLYPRRITIFAEPQVEEIIK